MQIKRLLSLVLAVFLYAGSISAQANKINFVEYDLDNGLHVILHEDHSTPIVTVSVMYHVGSKNENPDRTGFAHFFEHLLFEGSENIDRGEFFKIIENAGGSNNANTFYDRTYYYETLPSNHLETGLWLESERMLQARVDIEGVETQREVVKEERRLRVDNQPYGSLLEETMKRVYKEHPYRWPVIGSMAHLDAAVEEDYKQFYADFYVPENAVLSIAGDLDIKSAKVLIDKYFSTIPAGVKTVYRPSIVEPPMQGETRDTVYDNIQLPAVIQAYRIPSQGTADAYAVEMLSTLLAVGNSSRLSKRAVDQEQMAVFAGAFPLAMEDDGVLINYGIANMGVDPADLERLYDEEVAKVKEQLISEKEFQKLQNQIENQILSANASTAGIAESLANYHMYFGDTDLINSEIEKYRSVTREDIQRVARKYLDFENRVVLYYLPKGQRP
ncbi:MAG: pitrilysin family protein [Saprospiraceae bacterium]|nr:pitrilysin family protein [Saprospiraceae bacterium]